jgi:hypothetical protein
MHEIELELLAGLLMAVCIAMFAGCILSFHLKIERLQKRVDQLERISPAKG